ncbi:MobF family relaxase [Nocardia niigatensis]|uniref:MobF family relaxase n=1 Tax=Nocardia niigatensis TaxID=209249 RepID=UPI0002F7F5D3|nr:MobF family relaxase [Nocardia niigatensis]
MSLAKLSAGDGYEYYVRNIATHDANERGRQALDDYYSERGESPGIWLGPGLHTVGLADGDRVSGSQMKALFGEGLHPDADAIIETTLAEQIRLGAKGKDAIRYAMKQAQLGRPFSVYAVHEGSYRHECAKEFAAWNLRAGRPGNAAIPDAERAAMRTAVAVRMFTAEHDRAPLDDRELSGWVARSSRPRTKAVAGYDLTFSPVKSVSALWALAPREVSEVIEKAHHAAIRDALDYIDEHAVFTRVGRHSVRQVETQGLIATAFDHRDSRAGDPDLHTHVVISNMVQRLDGVWGCLDGRMIYRHAVAASELYNTRLEQYLERDLGLVFADRAPGSDRRPVREIVGMDPRLCTEWSKREAKIAAELARLASRFQDDHGREPTPVERLKLSEQATLSTRTGKHAARSRAEQRADWAADAARVLGDGGAVAAMVNTALHQALPVRAVIDREWITATAQQMVETVSQARATWQAHHIRAEAERVLRGAIAPDDWRGTVAVLVETALAAPCSIPRAETEIAPAAGVLVRSDGTSVYTTAGATLYTSPQIIAAEKRIIAAAGRRDGRTITRAVELAMVEFAANNEGRQLNPGQRALVEEFATSGARLQVAIAPAGTGKTTSMQVLTHAWTSEGGTVIGLAPTAAAAAVLAAEIDTATATIDKLVDVLDRLDTGRLTWADAPDWVTSIDACTLVILDEAAKASTLKLDSALSWLLERGASVRAIGDDRQLSAVAAGGVIRDIVEHTGAVTLSQVMRFADPAERAASLAVRAGDPAAIAFYTDNSRLQVGTLSTVTEAAFTAWAADTDAGRDSILLAGTRDLVADLNARARTARLARTGGVDGPETELADGLSASAGDVICTRRNDYRLRISRTDHVRNGYRWQVRGVLPDGRITATHLGSGRRITLPADYVREHVTLGYATTIDTAQGLTVDTCHGVLTGRETRNQAYVMLTRGRTGNYAYVATAGDGQDSSLYTWAAIHPPTAVDVLTGILGRDGSQRSATGQARADVDPRNRLSGAVDAYLDALGAIAEQRLGNDYLAALDTTAEQLVPGITSDDAYPVLRQHLSTLALHGRDLVEALTTAVAGRELDTAVDRAAVLDWRIDPTGAHSRTAGPLPWLPAIPQVLASDPEYGAHLQAREQQILGLCSDIAATARAWTTESAPLWAQPFLGAGPSLVERLAIWRAAQGVGDHDRRLTGPDRAPQAERREQRLLEQQAEKRVGAADSDVQRWTPLARDLDPRILTDPYWPVLATELTRAHDAGRDIRTAAREAATVRSLPDEQPAAALRWRLAADLDENRIDPAAQAFMHTLQQIQADRWRQLSDTALAAQIRQHTASRQNDSILFAFDPVARDGRSHVDTVAAEHAQLDAQAADIRAAYTAMRAETEAAQQLLDTRLDLAELQRQARNTKWWQRDTRTDLNARIEILRDSEPTLTEQLDTARAQAREAKDAVGAPEHRWENILSHAADTEMRRAAVEHAQAADAHAETQRERSEQRQAHAEQILTAARSERQRRHDLPAEQRELEDRARAHLHPPEQQAPAARPRSRAAARPRDYPMPPPAIDRGHDIGL